MPRVICAGALAALLLIPGGVWAEADIPASCRMTNRPPGRCGWCALETLARHQQIRALYGLTESHDCRCCPEDLEATLGACSVSYHIQYPGRQDTAILETAVRDGRGAAVGFREVHAGAGPHIVTLIDIDADDVRVIDSNDQDRRTRTMPLERFLYWWDGFALVLEPQMVRTASAAALGADTQTSAGNTRPETAPKPTR